MSSACLPMQANATGPACHLVSPSLQLSGILSTILISRQHKLQHPTVPWKLLGSSSALVLVRSMVSSVTWTVWKPSPCCDSQQASAAEKTSCAQAGCHGDTAEDPVEAASHSNGGPPFLAVLHVFLGGTSGASHQQCPQQEQRQHLPLQSTELESSPTLWLLSSHQEAHELL
jgi:hypothetical protein